MVRPPRFARGSALALPLLLAGCVPTTSAFLAIPLEIRADSASGPATLRVPLAELRERMPKLDPADLAFYCGNRHPLPHRLVDADDDGTPDHVDVRIEGTPEHHPYLVAVSPGPAADGAMPAGDDPATGIVLRLDRSRN